MYLKLESIEYNIALHQGVLIKISALLHAAVWKGGVTLAGFLEESNLLHSVDP